jgi:hypothetical protein
MKGPHDSRCVPSISGAVVLELRCQNVAIVNQRTFCTNDRQIIAKRIKLLRFLLQRNKRFDE